MFISFFKLNSTVSQKRTQTSFIVFFKRKTLEEYVREICKGERGRKRQEYTER